MTVKIKICGIRSIEAAQAATENGADFLGFNFVPTSKRYISPADALKIISQIKGKIKIVGIFQDAEISYINDIVLKLGLDYVQLHGNEDNDYMNNISIPIIKSVKLADQLQNIQARYFLLDRVKRGEEEMVDFDQAAKLAANFPIFYAGGLSPDNVGEVIEKVKPFAVDVASGIETDSMQDIQKIKKFIKNAKEVLI